MLKNNKNLVLLLTLLTLMSQASLAMNLSLQSPAFLENALIPKSFTCDGADHSPAFHWQGAPEKTQSYVFIMEDPDAPNGTWTHWVLFNIPAQTQSLAEAVQIPPGALSGLNSWGVTGYRGPCPPNGTHRYFFRLYALDSELNLPHASNRDEIMAAMQSHILSTTELVGLYRR